MKIVYLKEYKNSKNRHNFNLFDLYERSLSGSKKIFLTED